MPRPTWTVTVNDVRLPIWVTRPTKRAARRVLVLAPGAGTAASHPWLDAQARALGKWGVTVVRFDFAYRARGRKAPDRLPKLVAAYRAVVARVRADGVRPGRLWLGGKSMGGRVASHVAAEGERCAGLVFYGYPLAPRGQMAPDRTAHWNDIGRPALFLTGSRDRLCPLPDLRRALRLWQGTASELVLPEGDHSFKTPKRAGLSPEDVHAMLADAVAEWMRA